MSRKRSYLQDAIKEEDGRDFRGNRMAVEWARGNTDRRGGGVS